LTVGDFKNRAQEFESVSSGAENPEIMLILVQLWPRSAEELPSTSVSCPLTAPGEGTFHSVRVEIRHAQVAQQNAAVGVGIRAHSAGRPLAPVRPIPV